MTFIGFKAEKRVEHAVTPRPFRVRPLPRDELPMPPQNRGGRDDRGDLVQHLTAQPLPADGHAAPFVIGQSKSPPTQLPPEDPILFDLA